MLGAGGCSAARQFDLELYAQATEEFWLRLAAVYQKMGIRIACSRQADTVVEDVALPGEVTQRTNPEVAPAAPPRRGAAVPNKQMTAEGDERARWHGNKAEQNHQLIEEDTIDSTLYYLDPMEAEQKRLTEVGVPVANPL
jgi:hypothetical protein